MAKQIEGVYERILECAKQEFLDNGFKDASLRIIAYNADTSTSSIYTRFGDKAGLFDAIVSPAAAGLKKLFVEYQEAFHQLDGATQKETMVDYSTRGMEILLDYIYDHFDEFRLLLDAAYGTKFQNFVDELARIEVEYSYKYLESTGLSLCQDGVAMEELLHIVTTCYFDSLFEVVRHRMDRTSARSYIRLLGTYHHAGFDTIFSAGN